MPDLNAPKRSSVFVKMAESVAKVNSRVSDRAVEIASEKLLETRALIIVQVIEKIDELRHSLDKIRSKHTRFDKDGKGVGEPDFSKEDIEKRRATLSKIDKYENAVNKAIDKGDYFDVNTIIGGKDKGENTGTSEE